MSGLLLVLIPLWLVAGFLAYLSGELRHLREQHAHYPTQQLRFFPPLGRGFALCWLGPLLWWVVRSTRPAARVRTPSAARATREHPAIAPELAEDGYPDLKVAR